MGKPKPSQDVNEALESLSKALEKHRLVFLYLALPIRYKGLNRGRETLEKEDRLDLRIPLEEVDNEGEFLFKHRFQLDLFAQRAIAHFGPGKGCKPKDLDRNGNFVDVEGGSYPRWELDEHTCPFLERTSDEILETCARLQKADTLKSCQELIEEAINVTHDNNQPRWYSSVLVTWEYLTKLDEAIATAKRATVRIRISDPHTTGESCKVEPAKEFLLSAHDNAKKVAKKVDDLVRNSAVMEHFRQMIAEYGHLNEEYHKACAAQEREHQENCQNVQKKERFRDREAGLPGKNWQWKEESYLEEYRDEQGKLQEKDTTVHGWFPPSKITVPPNPWPWAAGRQGKLTHESMLPAEYLLLACCHDYGLYGNRPPIITEELVNNCAGIRIYDSSGPNNLGPQAILSGHEEHLGPAYEDVKLDLENANRSGDLQTEPSAQIEGQDKSHPEDRNVSPHPVIRLADAVYSVEQAAESWKSMAKLSKATQEGRIGIGRPVKQQDKEEAYDRCESAKKTLIATIDIAVAAIPGVDRYIRGLAGTKPGEWTTELKSKLTAFRSAIQTEGSNLFCEVSFQEWRTRVNYFHEKQRFLRNIDTSVFDETSSGFEIEPSAKIELPISEQVEKISIVSLAREKEKSEDKKSVKEPPKEAAQAYKLYYSLGEKQQRIAEIMSKELKRPVSQGQVSRWLKQYKEWRESVGLPVEKQADPVHNIAPARLELGERTDGYRMGDPRHKRTTDED